MKSALKVDRGTYFICSDKCSWCSLKSTPKNWETFVLKNKKYDHQLKQIEALNHV